MDDFILFIAKLLIILAWALFYLGPIRQSLHMFQQNRYEVRRYWPWLLENIQHRMHKSPFWLMVVAPYILAALLSLRLTIMGASLSVAYTLGLSILITYQQRSKVYIKPLSFTSRVKRQIVVMVLLVAIVLYFVYQMSWTWIAIMTPLVWLGIWLLIIVMAVLTMPFEQGIKLYYIHLARKILKQYPKLIKVGITGSYGKTSSKNILDEILSEKYYVLASPASFNTPMGLTITIREQLKSLHQVFIAEMGADKVGEINFLSKFIEPHYGIVTSIGPQHLNTFKSIENIIKEKMRLVENLPVTGLAVLNVDNDYIRNYTIRNTCRKCTYAIDHEADYRAVDILYSPNGSTFTVRSKEGDVTFKTRLLGKHNIANILAGVALGRDLGLSWEQLQHAVNQVNYVEHRLQLKKINGFNYIDNAFNSNPEGSKMSLEVLKMMPNHRYIVTPGMIDLGPRQDELNEAFGAAMKDCADTVILVGRKQTESIYQGLQKSGFNLDEVILVDHVKEAFKYIETHARTQDIVLLENDLPDAFNR